MADEVPTGGVRKIMAEHGVGGKDFLRVVRLWQWVSAPERDI
ncbi:MAG TPA: hypothetical protein VJ453_12965 [Terriglobales bacterium]|nr:hypothetical protein [Terriglobales bacterium]